MRLRSLRHPDLVSWQLDPDYADYSELVRDALISAYAPLRRGPLDLRHYAEAVAAVEPLLNAPMTRRQRIRVYYVLGMAFAAVGDYQRALSWLDEATDLAYNVDDPGELLDLLYLRGNVNRGALRYSEAALDYREYLAVVDDERVVRSDAYDATMTLDVVLQLAGAEFFLAHYTPAQRLLEKASPLVPRMLDDSTSPELRLAAGTYAWFQSQIYRWRGLPDLAAQHGAAAARTYTGFGAPISAARSQLVIADITLDISARAHHEGERRFLAEAAQPHIAKAQQLAALAGDPIGQSLCSLVDTRYSRLAGKQENRIARIEDVARVGRRLGDDAILAQAFTALGDELADQGELEAAVRRYRDVRRILDGSDIPALEAWARRGEHRITEQYPAL